MIILHYILQNPIQSFRCILAHHGSCKTQFDHCCGWAAPAEGQDTVLVHTLSQDLMYIVAHCIEVLMFIPNTQYEVWIIIHIIYI